MATCRNCGADLPGFSLGDLSDVCSKCKEQSSPAKPKSKHPLADLPLLYPAGPKWWTATNVLLAVNCLVFLLMVVSGASPFLPDSQDLLRWGADYGPYTLGGQYWRLVTSAFVHIGIFHLLVNMYCLWRLGGAAEKLFRPFVIIAIYLLTGIGASLLSLSWNPMRVSAGASGAIFGIIGVLISVLFFGRFEIATEQRRRMLGYVVKLALYNLFYGLIGHIDNMAHLGGLVTGLLMGTFLARAVTQPMDECRRRGINVITVSLIVLLLITLPVAKAKLYAVELGKAIRAENKSDCVAAIAHLRKYFALRPATSEAPENDNFAHSELAYCLHRTEQYDEAEREYEHILAANPDDRWAKLNLAKLYVDRNDDAKAVSMFEDALRTSTLDAKDYKAYGKALQAVGRLRDSEAALRKSISLDPNDSEAHQVLASVRAAQTEHESSSRVVPARAKEKK